MTRIQAALQSPVKSSIWLAHIALKGLFILTKLLANTVWHLLCNCDNFQWFNIVILVSYCFVEYHLHQEPVSSARDPPAVTRTRITCYGESFSLWQLVISVVLKCGWWLMVGELEIIYEWAGNYLSLKKTKQKSSYTVMTWGGSNFM